MGRFIFIIIHVNIRLGFQQQLDHCLMLILGRKVLPVILCGQPSLPIMRPVLLSSQIIPSSLSFQDLSHTNRGTSESEGKRIARLNFVFSS